MLGYNLFSHNISGLCGFKPRFGTFVPGVVKTGLDRFGPVPVTVFWVLETSKTGPVSVHQEISPKTGPDRTSKG